VATSTEQLGAIPISEEIDLVNVRERLRHATRDIGIGVVGQTKFVTAGSELARNVLKYAGRGEAIVRVVERAGTPGVVAEFLDEGPGIADVDAAMADGFSTQGGLGMGLPGARRLVDEFAIWSESGKGTKVTIAIYADR
jgi:serine/threonine-protein kinase RsbT